MGYAGPPVYQTTSYNQGGGDFSGCGEAIVKLIGIIVFLALIGIAIAALWF